MKIKDIAEALHLSVSTVSKALNGAFDVSKETKLEVQKYAKEHGYKSRDERISSKTVRRLAVIYGETNIAHQTNLVIPLSLTFSKYARENNFEVVHVPINSITPSYDEFMIENNLDGSFILGINLENKIYKELNNTSIPTVLFDNILTSDYVGAISCDSINTISELVNMLVKLGHKKIGFIHGDKMSYISNLRFSGYIIGLTTNNIDYNPKYVYFGNYSEESGKEAAPYFIESGVTAVICSSDTIAIGLIKELQKNNIKVPEDISVTGYDDLEFARYVTPSLTTVKQDIEVIGNKAFSLLASIIMNRSGQKIVIDSQIIKRDSIAQCKEK